MRSSLIAASATLFLLSIGAAAAQDTPGSVTKDGCTNATAAAPDCEQSNQTDTDLNTEAGPTSTDNDNDNNMDTLPNAGNGEKSSNNPAGAAGSSDGENGGGADNGGGTSGAGGTN